MDRPSKVPLDVCLQFELLAIQLWHAGWEHYSARAIMHRIRWHYHVDKGDRTFKVNNNWSPELARWFMAKHPEQSDFFHIRSSPVGNGHSNEDYMGPYST